MILSLIWCLLVGFISAKWSGVHTFHNEQYYFSVLDMHVDEETGTSHIFWCFPYNKVLHYLKVDKNFQALKEATFKFDNILFHTAKILRGLQKDHLHVAINAPRIEGWYGYYDNYYMESLDGGETWSEIMQLPHENPYDLCNRVGAAMIFIRETGDIYWVFSKRCAKHDFALYISIRKHQNSDFTSERKIYENEAFDMMEGSIDLHYTMSNGKPVLHLFFINKKDKLTPILHMESRDEGQSFASPIQINPDKDSYIGYLSFKVASHLPSTSGLFGTYNTESQEQLRLFYSKDGQKYSIIPGTEGNKSFFTWMFKTQSMIIDGPKTLPKMCLMTQLTEATVEYSRWDLNTMKKEIDEGHPFKKLGPTYGVTLGSYTTENKIVVTAMAVIQLADSKFHLLMTKDTFSLQRV